MSVTDVKDQCEFLRITANNSGIKIIRIRSCGFVEGMALFYENVSLWVGFQVSKAHSLAQSFSTCGSGCNSAMLQYHQCGHAPTMSLQ